MTKQNNYERHHYEIDKKTNNENINLKTIIQLYTTPFTKNVYIITDHVKIDLLYITIQTQNYLKTQ